jgi:hypothetical protein
MKTRENQLKKQPVVLSAPIGNIDTPSDFNPETLMGFGIKVLFGAK